MPSVQYMTFLANKETFCGFVCDAKKQTSGFKIVTAMALSPGDEVVSLIKEAMTEQRNKARKGKHLVSSCLVSSGF